MLGHGEHENYCESIWHNSEPWASETGTLASSRREPNVTAVTALTQPTLGDLLWTSWQFAGRSLVLVYSYLNPILQYIRSHISRVMKPKFLFKISCMAMGDVMTWTFVSAQNVYIKILTPKVMVLGSGAFGRWWGQEGTAPLMGWEPVSCEDTGRKWGRGLLENVHRWGNGTPPITKPAGVMILDCKPPELGQMNVCCLLSPPPVWCFLFVCLIV